MEKLPDKSQRATYALQFTEPLTWEGCLRNLMTHTTTGWLRGYKLEDYMEYAHLIDNYISSHINENVLFIPPKTAITLYNLYTELKEFEGQTQIIAMHGGMGTMDGGSKHHFFKEDNIMYYLSNYCSGGYANWTPCHLNKFAHYFCTEHQWSSMKAIFSRIPGVLYI